LPWASFAFRHQVRLLRAISNALTDGGAFATFAYAHAASLMPSALRFRASSIDA